MSKDQQKRAQMLAVALVLILSSCIGFILSFGVAWLISLLSLPDSLYPYANSIFSAVK